MSKVQRQQGFTLLEIMIALAIFAVISILAWQTLDGAMRTSTASDEAATKVTALQRTYNLLSRDFYQQQAAQQRRGVRPAAEWCGNDNPERHQRPGAAGAG